MLCQSQRHVIAAECTRLHPVLTCFESILKCLHAHARLSNCSEHHSFVKEKFDKKMSVQIKILYGEDFSRCKVHSLFKSELSCLYLADFKRIVQNTVGTPKIIAKFTRRDLHDEIYKKRRNLSSKSTSDLGLDVLNRIYVNESLTAQSRAIFSEAKKFRSQYNFKFIWTRNGKVYLRKDESQLSPSFVFDTMQEFGDFRSKFLLNQSRD